MFKMTPIDKAILKTVSLELLGMAPCDGWPGVASGSGNIKVPLQFPPRVKSISKGGNWNENNVTSYEPLMIWLGSTATVLNLELIYAVVGAGEGKEGWGVGEVSRAVHTIMGYFYRSVGNISESGIVPPLIKLTLYQVAPAAGGSISTWAIDNASVAHSDELVIDDLTDEIYPQITTISLTLKMQTKDSVSIDDDTKAKKEYSGDVANCPKKEWY